MRELITGLQAIFEFEGLRIAKNLEHLDLLRKEMAEMEVRVSASGTEQFGASWQLRWRAGGCKTGIRISRLGEMLTVWVLGGFRLSPAAADPAL